jgi:hypothetical protein
MIRRRAPFETHEETPKMSATAAFAASPPLTTFLQTPRRLPDKAEVDKFLTRENPVIHIYEESALKEAQLNASTCTGDDVQLLADVYGRRPSERLGAGFEAPKQSVYMLEIRLLESACIGVTSETEKAAQLWVAEHAKLRNEPPLHAVWLPVDDKWPTPRLRIVATESMAKHFVAVRKSEIPSRALQQGSVVPD